MNSPKVCVVGAGCSGITAIKSLLDSGITKITCYEQNDQLGGNWVYTAGEGHSSVCETTHIISSKTLSQYSDFPMPEDYPDYPSHIQVLAYFNAYADHFDLRSYIKFNSTIRQVKKLENDKWRVDVDGASSEDYDYILVASGHHSVPRHPALPGNFTGTYMHSHSYKNNRPFQDKRVLVIGAGNSGCDCAVECSRVAQSVDISLRRAHYIIPKFFLGKPTDTFNDDMRFIPEFIAEPLRKLSLRIQIGKYENYGLITPDFPITKDHPTLNSELLYKIRHGKVTPRKGIKSIEEKTVTFADGHQAEYDVIIAATGYKISTPFFDSDFLDYSEADRVPLYLRMFHPIHKNLLFIGLVQPQGAVWPLSEAQSMLAAKYIKGQYNLPADMVKASEADADEIDKQFLKKKRHTIEVHYHDYLRTLQKEVKKVSRNSISHKLPSDVSS